MCAPLKIRRALFLYAQAMQVIVSEKCNAILFSMFSFFFSRHIRPPVIDLCADMAQKDKTSLWTRIEFPIKKIGINKLVVILIISLNIPRHCSHLMLHHITLILVSLHNRIVVISSFSLSFFLLSTSSSQSSS